MKSIILLVFGLFHLISCGPVDFQDVVTANNLFSSALYKEVLKSKSDKNFIVSPFSIETVLALTQSAAKGETGDEIRSALHLPKAFEQVENSFKSLLPAIKGNDQYILSTANKIYVKTGFSLKENYKKIATDVYQSGIESIDFVLDSKKAAETINQWVEENTNHKINNLVSPNDLNDALVILINALHFKGNWSNKFPEYATSKQNFFKTAKDSVEVDFMRETSNYNYYESTELNAKFLEIPFRGEDASFVIILPNERDGLSSLEQKTDKLFTKPEFSSQLLILQLPKFKIESKTDLKQILQNLGVNRAFAPGQADFSGIAGEPGDLHISKVLQKAFIELNEEGVEAAAATAVEIVPASGVVFIKKPIEFIADHPFIFYIKVKDIILFVGKVVEPTL